MQPGLGDIGHRYLTKTLHQRREGSQSASDDAQSAHPCDLCGEAICVVIHGSAFFSGARVTTESMSAIALTMKRAVTGVPS